MLVAKLLMPMQLPQSHDDTVIDAGGTIVVVPDTTNEDCIQQVEVDTAPNELNCKANKNHQSEMEQQAVMVVSISNKTPYLIRNGISNSNQFAVLSLEAGTEGGDSDEALNPGETTIKHHTSESPTLLKKGNYSISKRKSKKNGSSGKGARKS